MKEKHIKNNNKKEERMNNFSKFTVFIILFASSTFAADTKNFITEFSTKCPNIGKIAWTGSCIADYATTSVALIEDTICLSVESQTRDQPVKDALKSMRLSYMDVICNCDSKNCRNNPSNGCQGGRADVALEWIRNKGIVGGGNSAFESPDVNYNAGYDSTKFQHCLNFYTPECTFKNSGSKYPKCTADQPMDFNPETHCPEKCNFKITKDKPIDDYRYDRILTSTPSLSHSLQISTISRNPVIGFMDIYEDIFLNNGEDVYVNSSGRSLGTFAVKIVGYGDLNGADYWIVVLPFGTDVGKDGVVRVARGINHCSIEDRYIQIGNSDVINNLNKKSA